MNHLEVVLLVFTLLEGFLSSLDLEVKVVVVFINIEKFQPFLKFPYTCISLSSLSGILIT